MTNGRFFGSRPSVLCLPHLLEHQARRIPDAPAILEPGRAPLTYYRLFQHIEEMERRLRAMGMGRHDRIAVALPHGSELAVAHRGGECGVRPTESSVWGRRTGQIFR